MRAAIEVRDLGFTAWDTGTRLLEGIDLKVVPGERIGIVGPSGSGKSTLCMHLAGIHRQALVGKTEGVVLLDGQPHDGWGSSGRVGMVFQNPENQIFSSTVGDEVAFGLPESSNGRVSEALTVVGLEGYEGRELFPLSLGQKQRVVIAAFLAVQPDILILDEPTNSLDPPTADRLLDILSKLGVTVILVEHDLERVAGWADRVVEMEEGRVIGEGAPETWFSRSTRKPRAFRLTEALSGRYGLQPSSPVPDRLLAWMDTHRERFQPLPLHELSPQRRRERGALPAPFSGVSLQPPRLRGSNPKSEIRSPKSEILRFEHVNCGYPGKMPVLSEVGLSVRQGEIVALLGLNATGKTTLLKHIGGVLKPRRGRILIEGEDIVRRKPEELFGKVGLVFQNPDYQIFDTTVAAECGFCLRNQKVPEAEIAARVDPWLEMLGIGALKERNPLTLSYGEKRRLTLASVLVAGPELIALDEPTTALDEANITHLREVLIGLSREHGKALLIATHDLDFALDVADRIVILGEGRVRVDVPVGELSAQSLTDAGFPLPLSAEAAMRAGLVERPVGCRRLLEAIRET
ncbi:MAG: energy-coupling factor ABC transporter ATP-binding protein [Candidatus Latescibacteria bacterium]|nr:energy-coupling factor ABC transporter ATP-binding protein [Candidatus Latescibacterota bacterium]